MLPRRPADRARSRTIEDVCDTHYEAINWGLSEVLYFRRGGEALGPELLERARRDVGEMHRWLDHHLGNALWLEGEQFGWADMAALPQVTMSTYYGVSPEPGSRITRWLERARERPSVSETLAEAEASLSVMDHAAKAFADGKLIRQYRDHRLEWMLRSGGLAVLNEGVGRGNIRFNESAGFSRHALFSGDPG